MINKTMVKGAVFTLLVGAALKRFVPQIGQHL